MSDPMSLAPIGTTRPALPIGTTSGQRFIPIDTTDAGIRAGQARPNQGTIVPTERRSLWLPLDAGKSVKPLTDPADAAARYRAALAKR